MTSPYGYDANVRPAHCCWTTGRCVNFVYDVATVLSHKNYGPVRNAWPRVAWLRRASCGSAFSLPMKFTSKERDAETGLDYFAARYRGGAMGRFTSPDPLPASGRSEDSQSWNRYSYGLNNPLRFVDPSGMKEVDAQACKENPDCLSINLNVVYDQNASIYAKDGSVLPWVQEKVDAQVAEAKDQYGNIDVYFEVTTTPGATTRFRRPFVVTDSRQMTSLTLGKAGNHLARLCL